MTTSFLLRTPRFPVCVEPMAAVVPWTDCREWPAYAKSQICISVCAIWTHLEKNIIWNNTVRSVEGKGGWSCMILPFDIFICVWGSRFKLVFVSVHIPFACQHLTPCCEELDGPRGFFAQPPPCILVWEISASSTHVQGLFLCPIPAASRISRYQPLPHDTLGGGRLHAGVHPLMLPAVSATWGIGWDAVSIVWIPFVKFGVVSVSVWVPQLPPTVQRHSFGHIGLVSVNACLCLHVSPEISWQLVLGVSRLSPKGSWERKQTTFFFFLMK